MKYEVVTEEGWTGVYAFQEVVIQLEGKRRNVEKCERLAKRLNEMDATTGDLRIMLRNAWNKLKCRCLFNDDNVKVAEDGHCPYHGWQQMNPDEWDPIGDLEAEVKRLTEMNANFTTTIKLLTDENLTVTIPRMEAAEAEEMRLRKALERIGNHHLSTLADGTRNPDWVWDHVMVSVFAREVLAASPPSDAAKKE